MEKHYADLRAERRRLAEMMVTTDQMLAGVKRGLEEMRRGRGTSDEDVMAVDPVESDSGGGGGAPESETSVSGVDTLQVRLRASRLDSSGRKSAVGSVWPVLHPSSTSTPASGSGTVARTPTP